MNVRAFERQGEEHEYGRAGDLQCGEQAGVNAGRDAGEREEMRGEGDRAAEGDEVARSNVGGEVVERGAGWGGEVKESGKGGDGSDGGEEAGTRCVRRTKGRHESKGGDEDDDHAGDECGFRRSGKGKTEGLELVASAEKKAGEGSAGDLLAGDTAELPVVDGREGNRRERHAQEIEEQRSRGGEGGFDQDKGASPDEDDEEEEQVGEGAGPHRPLYRHCPAGRAHPAWGQSFS